MEELEKIEKIEKNSLYSVQDVTPPGRFELSLRVLGNEFIGIRLEVDDLKTKWITVSLITILILGYGISEFAPAIVELFK